MLKAALILITMSSKNSCAYSMALLPSSASLFLIVRFELFFIAGDRMRSAGLSLTGLSSD